MVDKLNFMLNVSTSNNEYTFFSCFKELKSV